MPLAEGREGRATDGATGPETREPGDLPAGNARADGGFRGRLLAARMRHARGVPGAFARHDERTRPCAAAPF